MRKETEKLEFKKSTSELKEAIISLVSMLNKHGEGKLLFGVLPNGNLIKNEISESTLRNISRRIHEAIEPKIFPLIEIKIIDGIEIIEIKVADTEQPYSAFGRYYIRTADEDRLLSSNELRKIIANISYQDTWESQLTNFELTDVDELALKTFFDLATKHGRLPKFKFDAEKLLTKLDLYRDNKLTNAGNVMFSKKGPVKLKLAIFATDEKLTFLDIKTINDNIFNLIDVAQVYIEKNIRWSAEILDFKRIEIPEIPVEALREILVNSFAHAQYNNDSYHEIRIHPSKIVVYSPGKFKSKYKPEDYVKSDLPSSVRNESITNALYIAKEIEQFGSGFKRVNSLCQDFNIEYEYKMLEEGFEFTFNRNIDINFDSATSSNSISNLSEQAEIVYNYLQTNSEYTREELSQLMSKSVRSIQRYLNELSESGYIKRVGSDKSGYWQVKK